MVWSLVEVVTIYPDQFMDEICSKPPSVEDFPLLYVYRRMIHHQFTLNNHSYIVIINPLFSLSLTIIFQVIIFNGSVILLITSNKPLFSLSLTTINHYILTPDFLLRKIHGKIMPKRRAACSAARSGAGPLPKQCRRRCPGNRW